MEESKKKKIIWAIGILIIIILVLLWVLRTSDVGFQPPASNVNNAPEFVAPSANFEFRVPETPPVSDTEFSIIALAKTYAERFGSWSTDNQGHNLEELAPLSSADMRDYLKSIKPDYSLEDYTGITTKSISAEILSSTGNQATVMVSTQRIKTLDQSEEVFYQDIEFELINSGGEWLVDSAEWQQ